MTTRGYYEEYSVQELKELLPNNRHLLESGIPTMTIEESVTSDDRFLSNTWTEAYKYAAYYFNNPSIHDRFFYLNKFRFNFLNLLSKTTNPDEVPDLRSRADFVGWVCKKHNEFLEKEEGNFRMDCNVEKLIKTYGPNYDNVKTMLGEKQYYF